MKELEKLLEVMTKLRDANEGCSWDLEQTFHTIAPYTIEEAYEVADAIEREDMDDLRDELGDLLFQVAFHAQMAKEQGHFDFAAVAAAINEKMIRRHPHVFGNAQERNQQPDTGAWEQIKAAERAAQSSGEGASAVANIPLALPALKRAQKLGKRAASVGFDWPDTGGVRAKIVEELAETSAAECKGRTVEIEEEIGDLLFSVVNLARHLHVDAEKALAVANRKFEKRFRLMEDEAKVTNSGLRDLDLAALEALWQKAKKHA